jgi:hypothetical protein
VLRSIATMPAQQAHDWLESERGLSFAWQEAKRLTRRSQARRRLLIFAAIIIAIVVGVRRARSIKPYEAEIIMRFVELDKELTGAVKPTSSYKELIWNNFLAGTRLREVIKRYKLYPVEYDRDEQVAIEAMRDDLDVKVWRNYFINDIRSDEARSVRVSIVWRNKDPELALTVVRALADLIVETQARTRQEVFEVAQGDFQDAAATVTRQIEAVRTAQRDLQDQLRRAKPGERTRLEQKLYDLGYEERRLVLRQQEMRTTRTKFELTAELERRRGGIRVEMIEPGVVLPQGKGGPIQLGVTCVGVFLLALGFGGLLVGAFDRTIRQADDVRHLGIRVLGAVPPFRGDRYGALVERLRAEDRLRLEQR